jgi:carbonic anhydrase
MSAIDELLRYSQERPAEAGAEALAAPPSRAVAILTCMDARIDLPRALGVGVGEVHVLRNAGGVVTDDALRSLAISQRKLGTREVMVMHHTQCGMSGLDNEAFRAELREAAGSEPPFEIGGFDDVEQDVRESVRRVRECAFLPHRDAVRGFVYDVAEHRVREIQA